MIEVNKKYHDYVKKYAIEHRITEEEAENHACVKGYRKYLIDEANQKEGGMCE